MRALFIVLLLVPMVACAQYDESSFPGIGGDSLNAHYIKATQDGVLIIDGAIIVDETPAASSRLLLNGTDTAQVIGEGINGVYLRGGYSVNRPVGLRAGDTVSFTQTSNGRLQVKGIMPDAGVVSCFWKTYNDGTEIINTASEVEFSDSVKISANAVETGMTLRFITFLSAGHTNALPTCAIRLKYNAEVLATMSFAPAAVSGSTSPIFIEWILTPSSSSTTRTSAIMYFYNGNSYTSSQLLTDATLSTTNFTNTGRFAFSAQWSAASAMNKITMMQIVADYSDKP